MLRASALNKGDIIPIDCTCIDYGKLETLTLRGILYVVKMKKNLKYFVMEYCYMLGYGRKYVTFSTVLKSCKILTHHARIITYADT